MKPKILITDKIHDEAINFARSFGEVVVDMELRGDKNRFIGEIGKYDALVVRSETKVSRDIIEASNLKIIARAGVGLDNIDLDAAKEKNITVVNAPESLTIAVTELTMGLIISAARNIVSADKSIRENNWERSKFVGAELSGKTIGIIGFGRIGKEVAMRAYAFGMHILCYDPYITNEDAQEFNAACADLDTLLKNSDIVSIHVPLSSKTKYMITLEKIKMMKKDAILVNTSRGSVINEKDLVLALENRIIKCAALDVYENEPPVNSPLLKMNNVVLTPHIGASSNEAQKKAGMIVVKKINNFFKEKEE